MEKRGVLAINVVIIIVLALLVLIIVSVVLNANFKRFNENTKDATGCSSLGGECTEFSGSDCPDGQDRVPKTFCETRDEKLDDDQICCLTPN